MTDTLQTDLLAAIAAAATPEALEGVRVGALGKAGSVTALMKTLGGMAPDVRLVEGPRLNALREGSRPPSPRRRRRSMRRRSTRGWRPSGST